MTAFPLVTIGLSTYNRANGYLPEALTSALAQNYPNLEILVSDNASTDGTAELVGSRADERVRYVRQPVNIGANANFNFCLNEARGDYFLLLHDDDLIDPDFVSTCISAASGSTEYGLIRTGTRVIDDQRRVVATYENHTDGLDAAELFLAWFTRRTAFYLCSTLYNTALLRRYGGFASPRNLLQDVVATAEVAARHARVDVPAVKASFRRHDSNQGSARAALDWAEDAAFLLDRLSTLMPDRVAELAAAGRPYLCRKCYRNVPAIPSAAERQRTYAEIDRRFGHTYPPTRYRLELARDRAKSTLRRLLMGDDPRSRRLETVPLKDAQRAS